MLHWFLALQWSKQRRLQGCSLMGFVTSPTLGPWGFQTCFWPWHPLDHPKAFWSSKLLGFKWSYRSLHMELSRYDGNGRNSGGWKLWVKSHWMKNRGRWDAGFRCPLLRHSCSHCDLPSEEVPERERAPQLHLLFNYASPTVDSGFKQWNRSVARQFKRMAIVRDSTEYARPGARRQKEYSMYSVTAPDNLKTVATRHACAALFPASLLSPSASLPLSTCSWKATQLLRGDTPECLCAQNLVCSCCMVWTMHPHIHTHTHTYIHTHTDIFTIYTSSTAQGGGGSFRIGNL